MHEVLSYESLKSENSKACAVMSAQWHMDYGCIKMSELCIFRIFYRINFDIYLAS